MTTSWAFFCIITNSCKTNQKMVDSLIKLLEKLKIYLKQLLQGTSYDNKDDHFRLGKGLNRNL
ncbi:MAG: hypothetical protein ACTSRP_17700 [Candidatus Helarchaeota archaeon]